MLEVKGLSHAFGDNVVLENVNLRLEDGKIMGLVGINGAGKSTLLRLISGIYHSPVDCVLYDGRSPMDEATRRDIFLLPDDPYFAEQTKCKDLYEMYKVFFPKLDKDVFYDMIHMFKLPEKKTFKAYSKGMRRQAYIALAFAVSPRYMLLDEAFDGLDPLARKFFKDKIKELVRTHNTTVIVSSHSLKELDDFCDEYAIIDEKHVISSGTVFEKTFNYCKFLLAFTQIPTEKMFENMPVKSLKITGRFVSIVLEADPAAAELLLNRLGPAVMDKVDVNFEEAFIGDIDSRIRNSSRESIYGIGPGEREAMRHE